jgi:hypothetical protein
VICAEQLALRKAEPNSNVEACRGDCFLLYQHLDVIVESDVSQLRKNDLVELEYPIRETQKAKILVLAQNWWAFL